MNNEEGLYRDRAVATHAMVVISLRSRREKVNPAQRVSECATNVMMYNMQETSSGPTPSWSATYENLRCTDVDHSTVGHYCWCEPLTGQMKISRNLAEEALEPAFRTIVWLIAFPSLALQLRETNL